MRILMPLPNQDFDPTESAIPWRELTGAGHEVVFATATACAARADERMLTGSGLGPWRPILAARRDAVEAYRQMAQAAAFTRPVSWEAAAGESFDAIVLPGGHAPGMRPYLESPVLQRLVAEHVTGQRPLAAICHGVVVAARATAAATGRSILEGRRVTALPATMELSAWAMTALWLGRYYRTYEETVQGEVTRALGQGGRFVAGPPALLRDRPDRLGRGFVVHDGDLLTARWPGDAYRFSTELLSMLEERRGRPGA